MERAELVLAEPVCTDGNELHYFCEGCGEGGDGGRLTGFRKTVYKLMGGQR